MNLPVPETPLYNHPLPLLEQWLRDLGGEQDRRDRHCWNLHHRDWTAVLMLETEELVICYFPEDLDRQVNRSFKYSLSRRDVEAAILEGP